MIIKATYKFLLYWNKRKFLDNFSFKYTTPIKRTIMTIEADNYTELEKTKIEIGELMIKEHSDETGQVNFTHITIIEQEYHQCEC